MTIFPLALQSRGQSGPDGQSTSDIPHSSALNHKLVVNGQSILDKPQPVTTHHKLPERDNESFAPYWTAEPGWHTELQLRNNLAQSNLTVTPVLRLFDGREIKLSPVTIPPSAAVSVDVSHDLYSVAPELVNKPDTYGSVAFVYTSVSGRNLYASVMLHMEGQPIGYHVDAFPIRKDLLEKAFVKRASAQLLSPANTLPEESREGVWWLPHPETKDMLVLSNGGERSVIGKLVLHDGSGKEWKTPIELGSYQSKRFVIADLVRSSGLSGNYGGIKFTVSSSVGAVDSVHFLYDATVGFSALMKMFDRDPAAKNENRVWAGNKQWALWAPMLALQNPDPAVGFPKGTVLQPLVFVHNTTSKTLTANLSLNWRGDSGKGTVALPLVTLEPYGTVQVDVGSMQKRLSIPDDAHWALVTLTPGGASKQLMPVSAELALNGQDQLEKKTIVSESAPDDLIAVAASYDATGRYGAQTPFSDQLSEHWVGTMWQVDGTHNSIVAVTNAGAQETDALLTLFFDGGKQKYEVQQTIAAGDQMWLNLGDLIRNRVPDKTGRLLPLTLTSGTYELRDLKPGLGHGGNLFEGKIIVDKTLGHLTYGCMVCCGYGGAWLDPDKLLVNVGGLGYSRTMAYDTCNGYPSLVGFASSWWTNFSQIAAYQPDLTGLGAGDTGNFANGLLASGDGQTETSRACPYESVTAQDGVTVQPVTPMITSISPAGGAMGTDVKVTITGTGFSQPNMSISIGAGVTYAIKGTPSDTQIPATFSVPPNTTAGNTSVTVTAGGLTSAPANFNLVCAVPQNLRSTEVNLPDGSLVFDYTFVSSTGNVEDLRACTTRESVFYPGSRDPYVWPLPMLSSTANPTVLPPGPDPPPNGRLALMHDRNFPPTSFDQTQPYFADGFTATQRLTWTCPCYQQGNLQNFIPDIPITRRIFLDSADQMWKYKIEKAGFTNAVTLPGQNPTLPRIPPPPPLPGTDGQ